MLLKRIHRHDPNGLKRPVVSGVIVKRICANGKQKFSVKVVKTGIAEGWMFLSEKLITIKTPQGDMKWKIIAGPGRYCCHCGEKLMDDQTGAAAREHVKAKHAGKKSPDAEHPAGYRMNNYYDCELEVKNG